MSSTMMTHQVSFVQNQASVTDKLTSGTKKNTPMTVIPSGMLTNQNPNSQERFWITKLQISGPLEIGVRQTYDPTSA